MTMLNIGIRTALRKARFPILPIFLLFCTVAPSQAQPADEIADHLLAIQELTQSALEHSQAAESAESLDALKRHVDAVFAAIWGHPSGIEDGFGAAEYYGWKTRWQSDVDDFELETPEKFGTAPAEVTDPAELGIMGRGLHVRELLYDLEGDNPHYGHVIASLSNVIGWMRMDYADARGGMPRVDLTAQWDAPTEFWLSTADTGWIQDAFAQTLNILKTDYDGDLAAARSHAADLTALVQKALSGLDADEDGSVAPAMMEGGLDTALQHAGFAGIIQQ